MKRGGGMEVVRRALAQRMRGSEPREELGKAAGDRHGPLYESVAIEWALRVQELVENATQRYKGQVDEVGFERACERVEQEMVEEQASEHAKDVLKRAKRFFQDIGGDVESFMEAVQAKDPDLMALNEEVKVLCQLPNQEVYDTTLGGQISSTLMPARRTNGRLSKILLRGKLPLKTVKRVFRLELPDTFTTSTSRSSSKTSQSTICFAFEPSTATHVVNVCTSHHAMKDAKSKRMSDSLNIAVDGQLIWSSQESGRTRKSQCFAHKFTLEGHSFQVFFHKFDQELRVRVDGLDSNLLPLLTRQQWQKVCTLKASQKRASRNLVQQETSLHEAVQIPPSGGALQCDLLSAAIRRTKETLNSLSVRSGRRRHYLWQLRDLATVAPSLAQEFRMPAYEAIVTFNDLLERLQDGPTWYEKLAAQLESQVLSPQLENQVSTLRSIVAQQGARSDTLLRPRESASSPFEHDSKMDFTRIKRVVEGEPIASQISEEARTALKLAKCVFEQFGNDFSSFVHALREQEESIWEIYTRVKALAKKEKMHLSGREAKQRQHSFTTTLRDHISKLAGRKCTSPGPSKLFVLNLSSQTNVKTMNGKSALFVERVRENAQTITGCFVLLPGISSHVIKIHSSWQQVNSAAPSNALSFSVALNDKSIWSRENTTAKRDSFTFQLVAHSFRVGYCDDKWYIRVNDKDHSSLPFITHNTWLKAIQSIRNKSWSTSQLPALLEPPRGVRYHRSGLWITKQSQRGSEEELELKARYLFEKTKTAHEIRISACMSPTFEDSGRSNGRSKISGHSCTEPTEITSFSVELNGKQIWSECVVQKQHDLHAFELEGRVFKVQYDGLDWSVSVDGYDGAELPRVADQSPELAKIIRKEERIGTAPKLQPFAVDLSRGTESFEKGFLLKIIEQDGNSCKTHLAAKYYFERGRKTHDITVDIKTHSSATKLRCVKSFCAKLDGERVWTEHRDCNVEDSRHLKIEGSDFNIGYKDDEWYIIVDGHDTSDLPRMTHGAWCVRNWQGKDPRSGDSLFKRLQAVTHENRLAELSDKASVEAQGSCSLRTLLSKRNSYKRRSNRSQNAEGQFESHKLQGAPNLGSIFEQQRKSSSWLGASRNGKNKQASCLAPHDGSGSSIPRNLPEKTVWMDHSGGVTHSGPCQPSAWTKTVLPSNIRRKSANRPTCENVDPSNVCPRASTPRDLDALSGFSKDQSNSLGLAVSKMAFKRKASGKSMDRPGFVPESTTSIFRRRSLKNSRLKSDHMLTVPPC